MDTDKRNANRTNQADPFRAGDTLDALDMLLVLANRRWRIGVVTLAAFIAGAVVSLLLKPDFTATAIILPPQQQSSSASLLSQLGPLALLGGGTSAFGRSPSDMYVGILQSRTIADDIIAKFHLQKTYRVKRLVDTRAALKSHTEFETGKDSLIHISVTDRDPNRASDIANAFVDELYGMNSKLAISDAGQRRVFFVQQLDGEKKALTLAEEDLRTTQQRTGLIEVSGQAAVVIHTIAELRAEIASREVELQSILTFATEQNPDVTRIQQEISTMRAQLAKLENDEQRQAHPGNIAVPAGRVPEDTLEYARKLREVKYHEVLVDLLARQYEAARIDEAKSAPIIQVIDHAVPPDKKSAPRRLFITLGSGFLGFFTVCLWIFVKFELGRMTLQSHFAARIDKLGLGL